MTFDDRIHAAVDGAVAQLRAHLDADLSALSQAVVRAATADPPRPPEPLDPWPASRLASSVRALDESTSLGTLLDRLAQVASRDAERAAVLIVNGRRLRGWALRGFGPEVTPGSIELDLEQAALAGAAVSSGVTQATTGVAAQQPAARPPFARDGGARHADACPVSVGGHVVAVLYVDAPAGDAAVPRVRSSAALDVLARYAGRVLESITLQRASGPLPSGQAEVRPTERPR